MSKCKCWVWLVRSQNNLECALLHHISNLTWTGKHASWNNPVPKCKYIFQSTEMAGCRVLQTTVGHEHTTKWTHCASKVCERNNGIIIVQTWSKRKLFLHPQQDWRFSFDQNKRDSVFPLSYGPGCCFVMKNGWRRAGGMLSQSLLEQAGPFLSTRECPVLWVFVLACVTPCQASSFLFPFYRPHTPFRPSKFSSASLSFISFYTGFFVGGWFVENRRDQEC